MSPRSIQRPAKPKVDATVRELSLSLGVEVRHERIRRGWTFERLAQATGLARGTVHRIESGEVGSIEAYVRIGLAFRWDPRFLLHEARTPAAQRDVDPVHAAMGEVEAAQFRELGFEEVHVDEPYQHFQFSGRADVLVLDRARRAILHIENRTRFPDVQGFAGVYNAKRAYLIGDLPGRLKVVGGWKSVTHVVVALWSSEVLHALRLRGQTFRSVCPDDAQATFGAWWTGEPPATGTASALVVFDPLPGARSSRRRWIDLADARTADPRYQGYALALEALRTAGKA